MGARTVGRSEMIAIAEHDVVRLRAAIATPEGSVRGGATGTVVHVHRGGEAFEVEFDAHFHVVTVTAALAERVSV